MRRIDTAANPSASAMRIAAAASSSRVNRGLRGDGDLRVHNSSALSCSDAIGELIGCLLEGLRVERELGGGLLVLGRLGATASPRPCRPLARVDRFRVDRGVTTVTCHSYSVPLGWSYYVPRQRTAYEESDERRGPPGCGRVGGRARQAIRRPLGAAGPVPRRRARDRARPPRPQRRREDDRDPHPHDALGADDGLGHASRATTSSSSPTRCASASVSPSNRRASTGCSARGRTS